MPLIQEAFGAAGAACIVCNEASNGVEWAEMSGAAADLTSHYVEQYAPLDVYRPMLALPDQWATIRGSLAREVLDRNPWYQDFVRPCGIADVLGAQILRAGPRRIYFGLHFAAGQDLPSPESAGFRVLRQQLGRAARLGLLHRMSALRASLAQWVVKQQRVALIVAYGSGRVVEMNAFADLLLAASRSLTIKHGRLVATDPAEAAQLTVLMASAAELQGFEDEEQRVLVGASCREHAHLVTVAPFLSSALVEQPTIVRVIDLTTERQLAGNATELFGLSPAERRLVAGILDGKTLLEMTREFNVAMPTLRIQLRSIFKRCGVKRQVDLVRLLMTAR